LLRLMAAIIEIPANNKARITKTGKDHRKEFAHGSELKLEKIIPNPAARPANNAKRDIESIVKNNCFFILITNLVSYTAYCADGFSCFAQLLS